MALLAAGVLLARDGLAARRQLSDAQAATSRAADAARSGDLREAREEIDIARAAAVEARARVDGPLWFAAAAVPYAGDTPEVVRAVVAVADAATASASEVLAGDTGIVDADGQLPLRVDDGTVDLRPVRRAGEVFQQIPLEELEDARERLAGSPSSLVLGEVAAARPDALELADEAIQALSAGRDLTRLLPGLLGGDEPRRYVLFSQNNAELRGTGGIIGQYAVIEADGGRLELTEVGPIDRRFGGYSPGPPVEAPEGFADRYGAVSSAAFLPNTNIDPHLPTVGPVLRRLAERSLGGSFDGVMLADPVGLARLLEPVGPITVPGDAVTGYTAEVPTRIAPEELPEVTMVRATGGGESDDLAAVSGRDEYLSAVSRASVDALVRGGWEPVAMARAIAEATGSRHLQVYSAREDEQEALQRLDAAGALASGRPGADLLGLSAVNSAGNKMDVHVGHTVDADVRLRLDGGLSRQARIEVGLRNPLPTAGMDQLIIGSMPLSEGAPQDFTGPPGLNRTWFTLWAPYLTNLDATRGPGGQQTTPSGSRIHDHLAVDYVVETPSRQQRSFAVELSGPVEVERVGSDLIYRLTWWHQGKAIPDRLSLRIAGPEGWQPVAVEATGGGDGAGMGVFGKRGPSIEARLEGQRAIVEGDASADVEIEVRFRS